MFLLKEHCEPRLERMTYSVYVWCQFEGNKAMTIKTLNICANDLIVKGLSYRQIQELYVLQCSLLCLYLQKTVNTQMCIKRKLVK